MIKKSLCQSCLYQDEGNCQRSEGLIPDEDENCEEYQIDGKLNPAFVGPYPDASCDGCIMGTCEGHMIPNLDREY